MKKLGLLIAVACLAQSAIASTDSIKAPVGIPNLAVLVAETGTSTHWAPEINTMKINAEKHLGLKTREVRQKLDAKIEARFQNLIESRQIDL